VKEVKRWIGSEVFHGAVYGLGMSLAVWIPLNTGTLADGRLALVCAFCALAGLSRDGSGWPAPLALPWIAAAWLLEGLGPAMLIAVLATAGSGLIFRVRRSPGRLAYDVGAAALSVALADTLASLGPGQIGRGIIFAATFALAALAFHTCHRLVAGAGWSRLLRNSLLTIGLSAAGIAASWLIAAIWMQPALRLWLVIVPALRAGMLIGSAATRAQEEGQRLKPTTPNRLRSRTAVALARSLPEGAPGGHLWRVEALSEALAERLGSEPVEVRRLRQAALLHHIGRLAFDDAAIEVHPRVVETTIKQLGFSNEVRTILVQSHEHWDGDGPRGLRGERIVRGARILAVADRYDQLAHPPSGTRPHTEALALLRREPGERYDPLMFEILDELAEQLEASGSDLTRPSSPTARTPGHSRLVDAEKDLQTLYSIERAAALPIGLRERLTLIAGLLRTVVPFEQLRIEVNDRDEFRYGDRDPDAEERFVTLRHGSETVGRMALSIQQQEPLDHARNERLDRAAVVLATMIASDDESDSGGMTDPATGLPNARYLRRSLALRIPESGHAGPGFGLIAVHVGRLGDLAERHGRVSSDRFLQIVAKRLASACEERETLVRLGPNQFIVLTAESRGGQLVQRWHTLIERATDEPIQIDGQAERVRLDAAHASHPLDGETLDDLLQTLETRLTGSTVTRVLPFRARQAV
jgi:GGDEF domain-containing protein